MLTADHVKDQETMKISEEIVNFFEQQDGVMVATIDPRGRIHASIKGIVGVEDSDKFYLVDLYLYRTFCNLKKKPIISLIAVDGHRFKGYCLQGRAKIIPREKIDKVILEEWDKRVLQRISKRISKSVRTGQKSKKQYEAHLPVHPKYLIEVHVHSVINLAPPTEWKKSCDA